MNKFHVLTKYIEKTSETESFGERFIEKDDDGTVEDPIQVPYVNFNDLVNTFVDDFRIK